MKQSNGICIFLCDRTGNAALPWAKAGWECYCVDLQHRQSQEIRKGNIHYVYGDVRSWVPLDRRPIIFMAAFPPCTHVTSSGASYHKQKGNFALTDSLILWTCCYQVACYSGAPFFIENPVGVLSTYMADPDYRFHPSDYAGYLPESERNGEAYTKNTCIWVGNGFKIPRKRPISPVERIFPLKKKKSYICGLSPSATRADVRAETPKGFSEAVYQFNKPERDPYD